MEKQEEEKRQKRLAEERAIDEENKRIMTARYVERELRRREIWKNRSEGRENFRGPIPSMEDESSEQQGRSEGGKEEKETGGQKSWQDLQARFLLIRVVVHLTQRSWGAEAHDGRYKATGAVLTSSYSSTPKDVNDGIWLDETCTCVDVPHPSSSLNS